MKRITFLVAFIVVSYFVAPTQLLSSSEGAADSVFSWFKNILNPGDLFSHWSDSINPSQNSSTIIKPPVTQEPLKPMAGMITFAPIAKKVSPAVVDISAIQVRENRMINPFMQDPFFEYFFRQFPGIVGGSTPTISQSSGSGVIISPEGLMATCYHVIKGASEIRVKLQDGQEYVAEVLKTDESEDLALLQIKRENADPLPYVMLGDPDQVAVGDIILVLGNAFGLGQTVTCGILSANMRSVNNQIVLQTDASVNPGNSGGAIVNSAGELVGIPNAILSRSGASHGVSFARPARLIQSMLERHKNHDKEIWFGVSGETLNSKLREKIGNKQYEGIKGVFVNRVSETSPLFGEIKPGDVIVSYNGISISSQEEFKYREKISLMREKVVLQVFHNGVNKNIEFIVSEKFYAQEKEKFLVSGNNVLNSLVLQELDPLINKKYGYPEDTHGVVIISKGKNPGFREGDIILKINDLKIDNLKDVKQAISGIYESQSSIVFQRGNQRIVLQTR